MKKHLGTIVLVAILFIGLSILLYPSISAYVNSLSQSRVVSEYKERVSALSQEEIDEMFEAAEKYNEALAATSPQSFFNPDMIPGYNDILDVSGTGIMGYVNIPSISVELPVYHTTEEAVLQVGVGHLQGTSFPIGGDNTHAVMSGHRGLPSSTLFTDLDRLEEGDVFTMTTLNRTITYQIDQIRIVEPQEVDDLLIVDGHDYCTLFTCTPYGINTHRMLLRGTRISNLVGAENVSADATEVNKFAAAAAVGIPLLTLALLLLVLRNRRRRKAQEAQKAAMEQLGISPVEEEAELPSGIISEGDTESSAEDGEVENAGVADESPQDNTEEEL